MLDILLNLNQWIWAIIGLIIGIPILVIFVASVLVSLFTILVRLLL